MLNISKLFIILGLLIISNSYSGISSDPLNELEQHFSKNQTQVLVIPGQNGWDGSNIHLLFDQPKIIHRVPTPSSFYVDLGQNYCIALLKETIDGLGLKKEQRVILHGSSQGSATALNYAAQYPNKISALILEGVLPSGNQTILHTVEKIMVPEIQKIPGVYYWLPYLAKTQMPSYDPGGQQAILNLENIPDIPIIIIHSRLDPQIPFTGAQALYTGLVKSHHPETYFIPIDIEGHVSIIKKSDLTLIHAIKSIIWNKDILFDKNFISLPKADLQKYQPDLTEENVNFYHHLVSQEEKMRKIDFYVKSSFTLIIVWEIYKILTYFFSYFT